MKRKSASGLPTSTVRKSAIHMPTSKKRRTQRTKVGTTDADFHCSKVGIPCADFKPSFVFYIREVGTSSVDFTVHCLLHEGCRDWRATAARSDPRWHDSRISREDGEMQEAIMTLPRERHTTGGDMLQSNGAVRREPTSGSTGSGDWRRWRRGAVRSTIKPEAQLATRGGGPQCGLSDEVTVLFHHFSEVLFHHHCSSFSSFLSVQRGGSGSACEIVFVIEGGAEGSVV